MSIVMAFFVVLWACYALVISCIYDDCAATMISAMGAGKIAAKAIDAYIKSKK